MNNFTPIAFFTHTKSTPTPLVTFVLRHWAKIPSSYAQCAHCLCFHPYFPTVESLHTYHMPIVGYAFVSRKNGFGCVRHWLELNVTLFICGTFTAYESIWDGRQQQQQLLYVWATIRVMCRHFLNNRFSYQWNWCRNSLNWWCARAAFKKTIENICVWLTVCQVGVVTSWSRYCRRVNFD